VIENHDVFLSAQESAELFEQANTVAVRISLAAKKLPKEDCPDGPCTGDLELGLDSTPPHQQVIIVTDPMGSFSTAATSTPIGGDTLSGNVVRLGHEGGLQDVSSCSSVGEVAKCNQKQVAGKLFVRPESMVDAADRGGGVPMSRMSTARRSVQILSVSNARKNEVCYTDYLCF